MNWLHAFLISLGCLFGAGPAVAWSCADNSILEHVTRADIVVDGLVLNVETVEETPAWRHQMDSLYGDGAHEKVSRSRAEIWVHEAIKGTEDQRIFVWTDYWADAPVSAFHQGQRAVFFANQSSDGFLRTDNCLATYSVGAGTDGHALTVEELRQSFRQTDLE